MRPSALIAGLIILTAAWHLSAAEDEALKGREAVTTAKERLVNKAADPQRVDDCKVPEAKRDAGETRSIDCPHLRNPGGAKAEAADR